ncbi:MAG TPA: LysM peptidoglycan-binding domain-containing protein [Chitinispirillaceae bacterium]|nr:LysM peptidoglycan-binding domain-containing protein [Chitinispirillaceae bacterium]
MKKLTLCLITPLSLFLILLVSTQGVYAQSLNDNENQAGNLNGKQNIRQNDPRKSENEMKFLNEKEKLPSHVAMSHPSSDEDFDEEDREGDRDLMEEALTYLNQSQKLWEQGDIEKALDFLDQAYTLVLETDGDLEIARQKDDLRLLISKRILAIYSSMQSTTRGNRSEIPLVLNADVEREIRSFQTCEKDFFVSSYQRSGIYREAIVKELKKAGLPEELSWLPLVESGFKIGALSRARALGLWQFIPSTGYKFGLSRDEWIDERMDADKSTKAAISYLKELHGMFGDWLTVLAAYNSGEGRVMRVISQQHINYLDRFWDLYHQLPQETARYVPRFLATLHIIRNPEKYGFDLKTDMERRASYEYKTVKSYKPMKLQDVAFYTGASEEVINCLNSELRHKITPDKEYTLKLPSEAVEKYVQIVDQIPQSERPNVSFLSSNRSIHKIERVQEGETKSNYLSHRVKRGESLNSIARKYRMSPRTLRAFNQISSKKDLKTGQRINIPLGKAKRLARVSVRNANEERNSTEKESQINYRVKKGDSLASLAHRFGTTEAEIKKQNRIKGKNLKSGKVIKISRNSDDDLSESEQKRETKRKRNRKRASVKTIEKTYMVKKGDSLYQIAQRNNISLDKLKEINKLTDRENLRPGQTLIVQ